MQITLVMRAFTIFTETKMHLVQPPKILHDHCLQFFLGNTVDPIEMEDNGHPFYFFGDGE